MRAEGDFGSWLASVLTIAAAQLGSASALTAGRPGSWEAQRVDELVFGTAGYDCEDLADSGYAADELDRTGPSCQAGQHGSGAQPPAFGHGPWANPP